VIGTGANSEFGDVFKMMQAEEVSSIFFVFLIWFNNFFIFSLQKRRCKKAWTNWESSYRFIPSVSLVSFLSSV
jgi:hypothetical protein